MLDVHRLRVFRSVVASGSVAGAATNLGYTPSAISQHLAALQRETGLTLLAKEGRGLRPTAAGLALAAEADGVLARLGAAETLVTDLRAGRTGSLSIAYFASVGASWLPDVVRVLIEDFPGLRLDLELRDDVAEHPEDRPDLQLLVMMPENTNDRGFVAHHLLDDPYLAVVPAGHRFAGKEEIELAELADEPWVDNDFARGWCRRNLLDACAAAGFSPRFHVEAHDYPTALAFVEAGIGPTVLPELGTLNLPPNTVAVRLARPTPVRSIYVAVAEHVADTPPARAAVEMFRATAARELARRTAG